MKTERINRVFDAKAWDYIPLANIGTNLKIGIEKFLNRNDLVIDRYDDRHFKHIRNKSIARCIFASIFPIISIPVMASVDIYSQARKQHVEAHLFSCNFSEHFKLNTPHVNDWSAISDIQKNLQDNEYTFVNLTAKFKTKSGHDTELYFTMLVTKDKSYEYNALDNGVSLLERQELQCMDPANRNLQAQIVNSFEELFQFLNLENPDRVDPDDLKIPSEYKVLEK